MNHLLKNQIINRIKKKMWSRHGFSLGELLAATLILLLASQVLAQGMSFGVRMYNESLTSSHGKQLCSTLTNMIETELRYTTSVEKNADDTLKTYFSPTYGKTQSGFAAIDESGKETTSGEIAIKVTDQDNKTVWQRLISSASYSSYGLKARVTDVTIRSTTENTVFHVTLKVTDKEDNELVTNTFDVIPVNKVEIK